MEAGITISFTAMEAGITKACLPDSLDLDRCLSILFWLSGCELAGSCDFAFVGALEFWSLRLRLRGQWHLQKRLCYLRQCHDQE